MNLTQHPLVNQVANLCQLIEQIPASPEQTRASIAASNLAQALRAKFTVSEQSTNSKVLLHDVPNDPVYNARLRGY